MPLTVVKEIMSGVIFHHFFYHLISQYAWNENEPIYSCVWSISAFLLFFFLAMKIKLITPFWLWYENSVLHLNYAKSSSIIFNNKKTLQLQESDII